jgi:GNAT superfamily N-acetyltransferase
MAMVWQKDEYCITTDKSRIDIPYLHAFLSNSYWAQGIPEDTVRRSVAGSLCFSVFYKDQQVGFARVITDGASFAYLCDVFIHASYRGRGLGKWLMEVITAYPSLQGLRRFMLATRDAHGLYAQFGFVPLTSTDRWMHIHWPDAYKKSGGQ